jgi:hypothetical protein
MAIALDQKAGISHEKSSSIEFPVVDVASAIGWDSGQAKYQLKQLEWRKGETVCINPDIIIGLGQCFFYIIPLFFSS